MLVAHHLLGFKRLEQALVWKIVIRVPVPLTSSISLVLALGFVFICDFN